jgi:YD repeat-containing protein
MPRPVGTQIETQTRTFLYGTPPGPYLLSVTNPENGTVTYAYTWFGKVATRTDARNVQTQYGYDDYQRLTQVRHYPVSGGSEDTSAQVNITYDTNPVDGSYGG